MSFLSPGILAPDFPLPDQGEQSSRHLSDLRGQPVLLAFSSGGWDPARAEGLAQINRVFREAGFSGELLSLSPEGAWDQAKFRGEDGTIPVLTDTQLSADAAQLYGVSGQHALFVLDAEGTICWSYAAALGTPLRAEELRTGLASLSDSPGSADPLGSSHPSSISPAVLSRREFLAAALGIALVLTSFSVPAHALAATSISPAPSLQPPSSVGTVPVTLHVNGAAHTLQLESRVTLLDALRERIGLTGSKKGCDHGQCGACTVHAGGRRINSCLALAVAYQGKPITTIEGLATGDTLHPVQAAFIQHDGFQCGFCTSGQIMSAAALLKEPIGPADADVRENMSGNLCRCGAYTNIVAAVQEARKEARKEKNNAPI